MIGRIAPSCGRGRAGAQPSRHMHYRSQVWLVRVLVEIAVIFTLTHLFASPSAEWPAYTNHAGIVVQGTLVALSNSEVVISNDVESVALPLTVFPDYEQRRMAADFATKTGDVTALRLPADVRKTLEASEKAIRRSRNRAAKGLCSEEESRVFIETSRAARKEYLDKAAQDGRITPSERKLLN